MIALTSLPSHILVEITSYLDLRTLKAISPLHSILRDICDIHLYRKISLPISNRYLRSDPIKPSLAHELEGYGWKNDIYQTGHLDASLKFLTPLLEGRTGYIKELSIDLKHRHHEAEMDLDTLTNPSNPSWASKSLMIMTPIDKFEDSPSELDIIRLQASLIRQRESPLYLPHLAHTFSLLPTLLAVTKLKLTIYESFSGYLPYLFDKFPNLTELVLEPHQLLVESPLTFRPIECRLPRLRRLRVEPMLNSLRTFVGDLLRVGAVDELILGEGRWTMDEQLASAIRDCEGLKKFKMSKGAREVLTAGQMARDDRISG